MIPDSLPPNWHCHHNYLLPPLFCFCYKSIKCITRIELQQLTVSRACNTFPSPPGGRLNKIAVVVAKYQAGSCFPTRFSGSASGLFQRSFRNKTLIHFVQSLTPFPCLLPDGISVIKRLYHGSRIKSSRDSTSGPRRRSASRSFFTRSWIITISRCLSEICAWSWFQS